jgi:hypothetical protein
MAFEKFAKDGSSAEFDSMLELDIPPVIRCATCLRLECDGCGKPYGPKSVLAWENREGSLLIRCWVTARQSVSSGVSSCLDVRSPRRALSFAIASELAAALSLALSFFLVLLLAFPSGAVFLLGQPSALLASGVLVLGLCAFMVIVHLLWGLGLELGVWLSGGEWQPGRSVAFALYACGWDLLTSPVGALAAIASVGFKPGMAEVREAMRVPRAAVTRYVVEARGVSVDRANAVAIASFLPAALFALAVIFAGLFLVFQPVLALVVTWL